MVGRRRWARRSPLIKMGAPTRVVRPRTREKLAILEPRALPRARPELPAKEAVIATETSGREVAKAKRKAVMAKLERPRRRAR